MIENTIEDEKMMTKQDVMDHLIAHNDFRLLAPSTMICDRDYGDRGRDVITVSFRNGVIIITSDGINVCPSWKIITELNSEYFWNMVLQDILQFF